MTNTFERIGECDGGESSAACERLVANVNQSVWQCEGSEATTAFERIGTDALEGFGQREEGESAAAPERFITDLNDPVRDDDISYGNRSITMPDDFAAFGDQLSTGLICMPLLHLATDELLVRRLIPGWFQSSRWRVW